MPAAETVDVSMLDVHPGSQADGVSGVASNNPSNSSFLIGRVHFDTMISSQTSNNRRDVDDVNRLISSFTSLPQPTTTSNSNSDGDGTTVIATNEGILDDDEDVFDTTPTAHNSNVDVPTMRWLIRSSTWTKQGTKYKQQSTSGYRSLIPAQLGSSRVRNTNYNQPPDIAC